MPPRARLRMEIHGAVQGVGFRPHVHRLAREHSLTRWVRNDGSGVYLEVEGPREALERFADRVASEAPPLARIVGLAREWLAPAGFAGFEIRASDRTGAKRALIQPDLATCPECRAEILAQDERRHRYPFTNCTACGPRFSILRALPYDRPNTTMAGFRLCPECAREYADVADRRFHAQPIACPRCGPALALWDGAGAVLATGKDALARAAGTLADGGIVAIKAIGGFHLCCDARNAGAVAALRARKHREEKPFALLVRDLDQARALCEVNDVAAAALASPAAPIVLLPRRPDAAVAAGVAPGLSRLGLMLPSNPLQILLARSAPTPLVATSGNLGEEPICIDEREAVARLGAIADGFLVHDRPIERHADDSIGRVVSGRFTLLRRARGYAPLPVRLAREGPAVLAVGGQLKNTIAVAAGRDVFLSQHIGDLATPGALAAFERVIADLLRLYEVRPAAVAHDLHPDYAATRWAIADAPALAGAERIAVQHHHAHLAACLAEHRHEGPALGIVWDGTGDGGDGTVWGGEFLLGDAAGFTRVGHLRPFRLPGGEAAVREPRRVALALLAEVGSGAPPPPALTLPERERAVLERMIDRGLNSPLTTSAGRLFDGVAALLGLHPRVTFEGQAAMALEALADPERLAPYPFAINGEDGRRVLDWRPTVAAVVDERARGIAPAAIARRFHETLVAGALQIAAEIGASCVALTGGCFQNALLADELADRLREAGFTTLLHREVPPNDGGLSLGQVAVARARLARGA